MEAVILLGAPGAGKGTVADTITSTTAYRHFSTGDILREAIARGTTVGLEAKKFMDAGELVPDAVIMKLVAERLSSGGSDAKYLFDGFPRTIEQARLLDVEFADLKARLTHVFLLDAPREILIDRIANRLVCKKCGRVYHRRNIKPKVDGVCDDCNGPLYQRPDDNEDTVRNRLEVFKKQTSSLVDYYEKRGILVRVTADSSPAVTERQVLPYLQQPS